MPNHNWKEFIQKAKEVYRKIGSVPCPAFDGELIYFTSSGFKHLIFKDRKYRSKNEQVRRIHLIPHIINILKSNDKHSGYRSFSVETDTSLNTTTITHHLWSFIGYRDNKKITVVVRQIGTKSKHFLSIMNK